MFGPFNKTVGTSDHSTAPAPTPTVAPRVARRFGCVRLAALIVALSAGPWAAAAGEIAVVGEHLGVRVEPQVAQPSVLEQDSAEVGLESMLRVRTAAGGSQIAVELGHAGTARAGQPIEAFDQEINLRGRLSNLATGQGDRLATEIVAGYRTGGLAALDAGRLATAVRLRTRPAARLSTATEIGWWGRPATGAGAWEQGAHGRIGLRYRLSGHGSIGAFERVGVSGPGGRTRSFKTGVRLDFGPHTLSLSQRLDTVGRRPARALATAAAYGWQVGPVGVALSADYTAASETEPATGFAGLAVSFGFAGPGPGALLDALR